MEHVVMTLVGVVALCATSPAWCEDAAGSSRGMTTPLTLGQQALAAALAAPAPVAKDEADWQRRFDEAKARRGRGMRKAFTGAGVGLVSLLFAEKAPKVALAGTLAATAYACVGTVDVFKAGATIDDLREEGARKGYYRVRTTDGLSLGILRGGARVAVRVSF